MKKYLIANVLLVLCLVSCKEVETKMSNDFIFHKDYESIEKPIEIPFEMYRNCIRMEASVNNTPCYVLLDNGSLWDELMFFGSPKVDSLELEIKGETFLGDSTVTANVAENVSVDFDQFSIRDQKAIITNYTPGLPNIWEGADLQVSAVFFKNFVVEIDFDKNILKLHKPENFQHNDEWEVLPLKPGPHNSRLIETTIVQFNNTEINIDLLLDLGGIHPIYLPIGKRDDIKLPLNAEETSLAIGVNGYKGKIRSIKLGKYTLTNIPVAYTNVSKDANEYGNTMIGMKLIKKFNIIFDYPKERIMIKPSTDFNKPFK